MQRNIEELTLELIRLPKRERLEIARFLLFLDNRSSDSSDISSAWEQEITDRVHAVEDGTAIGIDYEKSKKANRKSLCVMKVIILQQAHKELDDAVNYYEGEQDGLGLRMMEEVDKHVKWILRNPTVPLLREGGYRRVNLKTFPYYIAYMIREDILWILAIAHGHCKPEYWIKRKNAIS